MERFVFVFVFVFVSVFVFVFVFVFVSVFVFLFVFDDDNGDDEKHDGCNQDKGVIGLPLVVAVTIIITPATRLLLLCKNTGI